MNKSVDANTLSGNVGEASWDSYSGVRENVANNFSAPLVAMKRLGTGETRVELLADRSIWVAAQGNVPFELDLGRNRAHY